MCACIILPGRFEWKRPRLCKQSCHHPVFSVSLFSCPRRMKWIKDHVAELVDGSEIRGIEAKKDGNFHLIFDAVRTGRLMGPKLVCVGGTSHNAKTCLQTSDATRWKSGRLLVKLCEDALVICSTLLFFSKICVIHSFRAYRQSRIPTGIFICFEFIFLMSHIFVGDGVHPFGSPLIFFNHNDLKREPNRKRKKTLKESRDSRYTFRLI